MSPHLPHLDQATFLDGSVVQLVTRDPSAVDAVVAPVHGATVVLSDTSILAIDGDVEWAWLVEELEAVHHGVDEPWSIFIVPGVPDHGVAVRPEDAEAFRHQLDLRLRRASYDETSPPAPLPPQPVAPMSWPARPDDESSDDGADDTTVVPSPVAAPAGTTAPERGPRAIIRRVLEARGQIQRTTATSLGPRNVSPAPLDARAISAWFGTHNVLDRVSLEMPAGQVTALIGPSGCGKSTFLRILNRMHELIPSAAMAGEVLLDGQDVYDPSRKLTDARREIGMVFQKPNPFPAMSIYDNVVASLQLTGTKATVEEKDEMVETCLSKAGLWNEVRDRLRQPGGGLSGGQQQRLCIARALAIRPRVLLMDEPCSALDPTSTRRIEETIHELAAEVTIVIVTHNMQQALRVSNRCAFFLAEQGTPGVIVEHGPTEVMFDSPQDPRTMDYVTGRFG